MPRAPRRTGVDECFHYLGEVGALMFFARVCAQRLDPHAQAETSEVARQIANIVRPLFPVSWMALTAKEAV